ncbi:uncharacterized protein LOC132554573 [Ylistrum balloti]|uniref:uncharacterized protein LOC132554573 n=1 Tax=Ylistrum balloti TaxID=509963 RepID=UPI002905CA7E|nr:uncharacterized protein LOC132554573 [Ylistrum balloti]
MATASELSSMKGQIVVRAKGHDKCPSHRDNQVVFLCQDCNILICPSCSITTHKAHFDSFIEISKTTQQNKNRIRDFINSTENLDIPKLKEEIKTAKEHHSTYKPKYKNIRDTIKEYRDIARKVIDEITENHLAFCDEMELVDTELLQTHITNLERRLDNLVTLSLECKETLQRGNGVLVYDSATEIQNTDLEIPQRPNIRTEFTPCKDRRNHLKEAMGVIQARTDHQAASAAGGPSNQGPLVRNKQSSEMDQLSTGTVQYKLCDRPTVVSVFSYRAGNPLICPTPVGRAWLCDYNTSTLNLINNKGEVLQEIQHNNNITDISLDPITGCLWFCCFEERTVNEVSTSSTPVRRFTTQYYPHKLSVTSEGRVVVGTGGRQGYKVVIYTTGGQVLHTVIVERSELGGVLSITQCPVTGNIAIVSKKLIDGEYSDPNNFRRHVIVYNPTLQPLIHYRGEGIQAREAVTPDKFGPIRVVYDSKGNIVISDWKRKTIELITGDGKYIKTLHTNKGQQGEVGIQSDDVLWSHLELDTGKWGLKLLEYYSDRGSRTWVMSQFKSMDFIELV